MSKIKISYVCIGLIPVIIAVLILFKYEEPIPDNALVYLRKKDRTYLSPPCLTTPARFKMGIGDGEILEQTLFKDATNAGYDPNENCEDAGGFDGPKESYYTVIFPTRRHYSKGKMLYGRPESRWYPNGDWKW